WAPAARRPLGAAVRPHVFAVGVRAVLATRPVRPTLRRDATRTPEPIPGGAERSAQVTRLVRRDVLRLAAAAAAAPAAAALFPRAGRPFRDAVGGTLTDSATPNHSSFDIDPTVLVD